MSHTHEIFKVARDLLVAGVVVLAYKTARDAAMPRWGVAWRGFLWCAGLAFFAAVSMGQPSCEEQGDPLRGTCEQYADDGFDPTTDQRVGRFLYLFLLLYVPVLICVAGERNNPRPPEPLPKR